MANILSGFSAANLHGTSGELVKSLNIKQERKNRNFAPSISSLTVNGKNEEYLEAICCMSAFLIN